MISQSAEITPNLERKIEKSKAKILRVWLFFNENSPAENFVPFSDFGFSQRHLSRYFNAISGDIHSDSLHRFLSDSRICSLDVVRKFYRPKSRNSQQILPKISNTNYGASHSQLQRMGVPEIHRAGFLGDGIKIAVFDTGFDPTHLAFQNTNIVAQHDFVQDDLNTQNEMGDAADQDSHGTRIMGIMGADLPGVLVGIAPNAHYLIAKTEKVDEEIVTEEDNWIAAVEWADSLGANIISSSLTYLEFDDGFAYNFSDLDGNTTRITQAANIASERGISVVTAAGNFGPDSCSIWAPADASPPVLTIGAVDETGVIADFSSRGPTADGRIKPDLVAQGVNVATVYGFNETTTINGTSASTPLIAGAVALIRQIHPSWTNTEIWEKFTANASHSQTPDNIYGYGEINLLDFIFPVILSHKQNITIFPNPATGMATFYIAESTSKDYEISDLLGRQVFRFSSTDTKTSHQFFAWNGKNNAGKSVASGIYFFSNSAKTSSVKFIFFKE